MKSIVLILFISCFSLNNSLSLPKSDTNNKNTNQVCDTIVLDSLQAQLLTTNNKALENYKSKMAMISSIVFAICFLLFLFGLIFFILSFKYRRKYKQLLEKTNF